ncbi:metal ABC transporter ATP-binding protein [Dolichospermum sp. UHCC 0684]|jgi:manganese/iron transport system ATP-binding protein|uniref:metal ABC transporter ATP-binding protein n=1 Tax=unclassified Dolichospermum TaxID=2622029 RepID=UPI001444AD81|nr:MULTISPECIES: metal ABC transporter ATP-binding protein [unclassified Dolichospermum]MBS9395584.1 metal ABC transporter ATP-binding protein [Dolichospermum sp. OL01]MCO5799210.1 metal ABC transporter ATP-binding protein [Dolichospermum sp. OL03]MCS6280333.1 metal ABC transporter ATP-binding protein [Dolichospermum sp.]QSV56522.1 MAG: metal ABC transporter ATP-binding protein [Dolichospermum sp. UKL201]QSV60581.1 MAG: metal ABC transporter ATP-binding protein [Dolichospermum sp. LBC05a]
MQNVSFYRKFSLSPKNQVDIPTQVIKSIDMNSSTAINITNIGVYYRTQEALRDVNCTIKPGRITGIFGPNGAGKSTLMKAILGLVPMSSGQVLYKNQPLMQQLEKVAYVPQRSQIDWNYPATVWDVVMMGRVKKTGWLRSFSTISRQIAKQALERVGIEELKNRPIGELSGGQQQRVFLARALTQEAEIFCFDEPFVGIDQKTQTIIFEVFQELAKNNKIVLVVNHDLGESITHFDDLILLNCELIATGSRQQVLTEENLYRAYSGKVMYFSDAA